MGSTVLSLRIDSELLDRLKRHAARRQMSVQDYVVRTLIRDDFDERFKAAVDETEKFYGTGPAAPSGQDQVRPSAGIA
ncbi:ribbon-helix-helix protein, CopG family [Streptomyces sp. t39]|uniref:ribbon-helix-helix protein, CopG family n=1 Tax=Streptomyces sp. t39 TaxID=1828156 RepID=UPI0011CDB436|nr:ribbon-helix-helix protein, CopG family [Streptomyces sp. t39]TXS55688.1 ribbon-helix-helix protein, CopG family [Streptomyces sp. t39]